MTNSTFTPSTLHVIAKEIDITKDLETTQTKSLGQLLEENNEENSGREGIPENSGCNS